MRSVRFSFVPPPGFAPGHGVRGWRAARDVFKPETTLRRRRPRPLFEPSFWASPRRPDRGRTSYGLALFRYRTGCGVVFGHTGSFPGYRLFAASTRNGRRSVVFTVNAQIVPGSGSPEVEIAGKGAESASAVVDPVASVRFDDRLARAADDRVVALAVAHVDDLPAGPPAAAG